MRDRVLAVLSEDPANERIVERLRSAYRPQEAAVAKFTIAFQGACSLKSGEETIVHFAYHVKKADGGSLAKDTAHSSDLGLSYFDLPSDDATLPRMQMELKSA